MKRIRWVYNKIRIVVRKISRFRRRSKNRMSCRSRGTRNKRTNK